MKGSRGGVFVLPGGISLLARAGSWAAPRGAWPPVKSHWGWGALSLWGRHEGHPWGALLEEQTEQHIPITDQGHISSQGQAHGHSTVGCQRGDHISALDLLSLHSYPVHNCQETWIWPHQALLLMHTRDWFTHCSSVNICQLTEQFKDFNSTCKHKAGRTRVRSWLEDEHPSRKTIKKSTHSAL